MIDHWLPIKSWSLLALLISQNGPTLIAITTTLLVVALVYQTNKNEKRKLLNLTAYDKLASEQEKLILQAADKTATEDAKPTGNAIARTYQKITGKTIDTTLLVADISKADEAGFIKANLANQDDEPILIWENQIPFRPSKLQNIFEKFPRLSPRKTLDNEPSSTHSEE